MLRERDALRFPMDHSPAAALGIRRRLQIRGAGMQKARAQNRTL